MWLNAAWGSNEEGWHLNNRGLPTTSLITVAADTKATRDGPPVLGSALRTDIVVTSSPAAPDAAEALAVGLAITSSAPVGLSSKPRWLKGRSALGLGYLAQPARVDCTITWGAGCSRLHAHFVSLRDERLVKEARHHAHLPDIGGGGSVGIGCS